MPAAARNFERIDRSTVDETAMWQPRAIVRPFAFLLVRIFSLRR